MVGLTSEGSPISVLVVDEDPSVLVFIARILDAGGMRALLARNDSEALEIAQRGYVPIDVILTNAAIAGRDHAQLVARLRQVRPGVRDLSMAACVDDGVVRIQPMQGHGVESTVCDEGLLESIRKSARTPLTQRAGRVN